MTLKDKRLEELKELRNNRIYFLCDALKEEDWGKMIELSTTLIQVDAEIEGLSFEEEE